MADQRQLTITEEMVRGWLMKAKAPHSQLWNSSYIGTAARNAQSILEEMRFLRTKQSQDDQQDDQTAIVQTRFVQARKAVAKLQAALAQLEPGMVDDMKYMTNKNFPSQALKSFEDRFQKFKNMQASLASFWISTDEVEDIPSEHRRALETLYECYCLIVPNSFIGTDHDNAAAAFLNEVAPALGIKGGTGNRNLVHILPKKDEMQKRLARPNHIPW